MTSLNDGASARRAFDEDDFREVQRLIERVNRELDEEQERALDALDDSILSTSRQELKQLRDSLDSEP